MASSFIAACVQLNAKRELEANQPEIRAGILDAAGQGATFITTPECTAMMEPDATRLRAAAPGEDRHPTLGLVQGLASETGAWILLGSTAILLDDGKIANRSYLFDAEGCYLRDYGEACGINNDELILPDFHLGEDALYKIKLLVASNSCDLIVIDSMPALQPGNMSEQTEAVSLKMNLRLERAKMFTIFFKQAFMQSIFP